MTRIEEKIKQEYERQQGIKLPILKVLEHEKISVPEFVFCMFEGELFKANSEDVNAENDNILDKAAALAECLENLAYSLRVYYEVPGGVLKEETLEDIKRSPKQYSSLGSGKFFSEKYPEEFAILKARRVNRQKE